MTMDKPAKRGADTPAKAGGRPSSYRSEYAEQARKLCRLGAIDKELADFFGVSEQTINAWKTAHPEFLESLKAGKELADAEVADKLFQRATGYSHPAVKLFMYQGTVIREEYTEHYPPDTAAIIFWLKNRRPDLWRNAPDPEGGGEKGPGLDDPNPDV
ncbi:helix-turn-helix domain-containing protein [Burkholderia multivorans]|uniref:helix-turn-helix domain-containing protein n=1 Tax=Burkholderia multivorans TaxID=87883 RepID=UPI000A8A6B89|nr:helix-turn-helix domain-containing protein [Burkholderia multivorans]